MIAAVLCFFPVLVNSLRGLTSVRPESIEYSGSAEPLREVWVAVRASLRSVLEEVTLDDVASGELPVAVRDLVADPEAHIDFQARRPQVQLVDGVAVQNDATGRKLKFLRRIPIDPMTKGAEWGKRSYQDEPDATRWGGQNVFDVYTTFDGTALDGTKYKDW